MLAPSRSVKMIGGLPTRSKTVILARQALLCKLQTRGLIHKSRASRGFFASKKNERPELGFEHIVQAGDPILREKSLPVEKDDISKPEVQTVIQRMKKVIDKYDALGLSAVQIGVPVQIVAVQCTKEQLSLWPKDAIASQGMEEFPLRILINPTIRVLNNEQIAHRESCCSVHGYSALVLRAKEVEVKYTNEMAVQQTWVAKYWTARILQHELDHLSGILFTDKMKNDSLMFNYWEQVNKKRGDFKLGFKGIEGFAYKFSPFTFMRIKQN